MSVTAMLGWAALFRAFGRARTKARMKHVDFVRTVVGLPSVWGHLSGQIHLAGEGFVQGIAVMSDNGSEVPEIPRV